MMTVGTLVREGSVIVDVSAGAFRHGGFLSESSYFQTMRPPHKRVYISSI